MICIARNFGARLAVLAGMASDNQIFLFLAVRSVYVLRPSPFIVHLLVPSILTVMCGSN